VIVVETAAAMRSARRALPGPVGFVPTMGALHDGHVALVKRARAESASVITSIFVNPTQFGPGEDFAGYPRNRERDLAIFEEAGADAVFVPPVEDMYPAGSAACVDPGPRGEVLEGKHRPGHFRGVATVVTKLFAIVTPDRTYFGEKDAQQLRIVRGLVHDLRLGVEIVGVPTVRAGDGLALSSRNVHLKPEERGQAAVLYRGLRAAEARWAGGERDAEAIRATIRETVGSSPLVKLEYVSVADSDTLEELRVIGDRPTLVSLAARVGATRLIDNMTLPPGASPAGTGRG
jgi:pantoate--beta-alanine ligase